MARWSTGRSLSGNWPAVTDRDVFFSVQKAALPRDALLQKYFDSGDYTDCFVVTVSRQVTFEEYVEAFYTTMVFKTERVILELAVAKPSKDAEARLLATGAQDSFAAWEVEERAADQLLLTDFRGNTRSWLMLGQSEENAVRLYFGSAVIRNIVSADGEKRMAPAFGLLLGFHRLYSRILLSAARARLRRTRS